MPLQKNQVLTLQVERLSSDGSGVAHSPEGETVFIPGAAPGDEARVRIVKDCKRYAFGILDEVLKPSPDRIPVDCAVAGPCGGCSLRHQLWPVPAAAAACGIWTMPPSSAPSRRMLQTPLHASAGWMFRSFPS